MRRRTGTPFGFGLLCLFVVVGLSACGASGSTGIQIRDAWVKPPVVMGDAHMGGSSGVAYMLIRNQGREADRLLKAQTDIAQAVELHAMTHHDGVMSMQPVETIELPAGGKVEFKPGGLHMMLIGVGRELKPSEKIALVLEFERAGTITVEAEVREG